MRPIGSVRLLAAAVFALAAAAASPARAQNQQCSGNAPQVSWSIGVSNGNGTFNTVGVQEIPYIINGAECDCATRDLFLVGRVNKALTTEIVPQVWTGTNCNQINLQPTNCEQLVGDNVTVSSSNFYQGAVSATQPAQRIPVRSLISPATTQAKMAGTANTCVQQQSISNQLFILFPFDPSNPENCSIQLTAKTTRPAGATGVSSETGDEAVTLKWSAPPVGTSDPPAYFQILCADQNGAPLPNEGAYGFNDPSGPPHQLAYTACIDPANHVIQRRFIAPTGTGVAGDGGTSTADLGTGGARGEPGPGPGEDRSLGTEASPDPDDGGVADMAAPLTGAAAALATLDRKFVCSDRIQVVGTDYSQRISGLKNGTEYFFNVVAVDKWGNATPSGTVNAVPQPVEDLYRRFLSQGGKPQGFCFIATAAFGSYQHPFVRVLRDFRDEALLPTSWGRAFVGWYYAASPPYAAWIAERPTARFFVRLVLWPVIGVAWLHLHLAAWQEIALALALLAFALRRRIGRALAAPAPASAPAVEKPAGGEA